MRLALLATGTDSVAVGVTVVATLLVVALAVAVGYLLKTVREMRREAQGLAREAQELLDELGSTVRRAGMEVDRVDRMVGSAEAISDAVGSASKLVGGAMAGPLIKLVAFGSGLGRAVRLVRRARHRAGMLAHPQRTGAGVRAREAGLPRVPLPARAAATAAASRQADVPSLDLVGSGRGGGVRGLQMGRAQGPPAAGTVPTGKPAPSPGGLRNSQSGARQSGRQDRRPAHCRRRRAERDGLQRG